MNVVRQSFRPEFINRLDEIVTFDPLGVNELREVARLQTAELNKRLADRSITIELTDEALDYICTESFDAAYGARPLRRWLEQHVVTSLSRMIISGELQGDSKVLVGVGVDGLTFAAHPDAEAAAARAAAGHGGKRGRVETMLNNTAGWHASDDEDDIDDMDD